MNYSSSGPSFIFNIVPLFIALMFIIVFGGIIFSIIRGTRQWNHNNASPLLSVPAKIVSKRTNVSGRGHNMTTNTHGSTTTNYYITFQFESGDRMEFHVQSDDYALLVEGDDGKLTFQGTRFKGFIRLT